MIPNSPKLYCPLLKCDCIQSTCAWWVTFNQFPPSERYSYDKPIKKIDDYGNEKVVGYECINAEEIREFRKNPDYGYCAIQNTGACSE